jgi:hypothetical protein
MKKLKKTAHAWPIATIGRNTRPMAASSGFYQSPGCPPLGNAQGIVPAHRHGLWNGQKKLVHFFAVVLFAAVLAAAGAIGSK